MTAWGQAFAKYTKIQQRIEAEAVAELLGNDAIFSLVFIWKAQPDNRASIVQEIAAQPDSRARTIALDVIDQTSAQAVAA